MGAFERNGYAIADLVLTASACDTIAAALPEPEPGRGGVRDLLSAPIVQRLVADARFAGVVREFVDEPLVAVKATLFDKTPAANWRVQWHQDRVLKQDGRRVELPVALLEKMLAVRIHLDASGPENGPLRVIPGTHRRGKLSDEEIRELVRLGPQVGLALPQGAILVMRPLLLHASSPAVSASHRRVLHIELAPPT